MASKDTMTQDVARAQHYNTTTSTASAESSTMWGIKRLQDLLNTITQQIGSMPGHAAASSERLEDQTQAEQPTTSGNLLSSANTVIQTTPAAIGQFPVMDLLGRAIDRTASLFATEPPRSPRAESQMSYSLNVNAKYRAHMDVAPERARELEKNLRGIKAAVEGLTELVEECRVIIEELAGGQELQMAGGNGMQAFVSDGEDEDEYLAPKITGPSKGEDGLALEERVGGAGVRSTSFV